MSQNGYYTAFGIPAPKPLELSRGEQFRSGAQSTWFYFWMPSELFVWRHDFRPIEINDHKSMITNPCLFAADWHILAQISSA